MPADRTQVNRERIEALADLLEDANALPAEAAEIVRGSTEIGEAKQRADEHRGQS